MSNEVLPRPSNDRWKILIEVNNANHKKSTLIVSEDSIRKTQDATTPTTTPLNQHWVEETFKEKPEAFPLLPNP